MSRVSIKICSHLCLWNRTTTMKVTNSKKRRISDHWPAFLTTGTRLRIMSGKTGLSSSILSLLLTTVQIIINCAICWKMKAEKKPSSSNIFNDFTIATYGRGECKQQFCKLISSCLPSWFFLNFDIRQFTFGENWSDIELYIVSRTPNFLITIKYSSVLKECSLYS